MFVIFCIMLYMSFFCFIVFLFDKYYVFVYVYDFPVREIDKIRVSVEIPKFKDYGWFHIFYPRIVEA